MLGRAAARLLLARGDEVTVLQRGSSGLPCREIRADIADAAAVHRAVDGHDAVLHLAAKVDVVGRWRDYVRANIEGTGHVVAACRRSGVPRLVHVSSPSVAHAGESLIGAPAGVADPADQLRVARAPHQVRPHDEHRQCGSVGGQGVQLRDRLGPGVVTASTLRVRRPGTCTHQRAAGVRHGG